MKNTSLIILLIIGFLACQNEQTLTQNQEEVHLESISLIPRPVSLVQTEGHFTLNDQTVFFIEGEAMPYLADFLKNNLNVRQLAVENGQDLPAANRIHFKQGENIKQEGGYEISVNQAGIMVNYNTPSGAFYALQTVRQLNQNGNIPYCKIKDYPRFAYRGMHLDVARHFFNVEEVKKYIDALAYHKFNRFHWHLTEDQGWRIEIKKYPKLQEISAFRNETLIGHYSDQPHQFDGKKYGGFYTQEEIKEVVRYAQERHITIIPEIEMPGHSQAVLAAYPEFGCTGNAVEVATKWGIFEDVYCPKEETFQFLEDVLTEVMALFPSEYIHIGGDECPKTQWKNSAFCQNLIKEKGLKDENGLQSYFIGRIEAFLNKNGRQIIGWDEILEGGLAPNATVMSWRGVEGGIEAARQKHDVIMTPTTYCYLDYYQSQNEDEPLAIGGYLPLEKVYHYEPIPTELTDEEAKYILGVQGNVWTEYMPTIGHVFYMAYPRAAALAEIGWSPKEGKDYADFTKRLLPHLKRLQAMGIEPANHLFDIKMEAKTDTAGGVFLSIRNETGMGELRFSTDETTPTVDAPVYENPVSITESTTVTAQTFLNGEPQGKASKMVFDWHKAAGKNVRFNSMPHPKYSGSGLGSVVNAVRGSDERYGDAEWLGFDGKDIEMVIDFGQIDTFSQVTLRFFKGEGQWIYLPKKVTVGISKYPEKFITVGSLNELKGEGKVVETVIPLKKEFGRFLRIQVENFGEIPAGKQGAGNKAWLFLDEVVVQ